MFLVRESPGPDQQTHTGDQDDHAHDGPDDVFGRRHIVDQRFMRPVVGIGRHAVGTLGCGSPGGPEKEVRQAGTRFGGRQGGFLHGEVHARLVHGDIVAKQLVVVDGRLGHRLGTPVGHRDHARLRIIGILAVFGRQTALQRGLGIGVQLGIVHAILFLGSQIQPGRQFTMQPVGGPVRRLIGTVPQDRPDRHPAGRLPGALPIENLLFGHQDFAVDRGHLGRNGRGVMIDLLAHPAQDGKSHQKDADQRPPQLLVLTHSALLLQLREVPDKTPGWRHVICFTFLQAITVPTSPPRESTDIDQ